MKPTLHGIRSPVKRQGAEGYVLTSLVSFAMSVILTRLFLQLTGYPQLGNSTLHIAHVLWGGLLLFVAALLPLILSNRWAFNASAILSGVGVGLFIDEVGKFITQTNDYFYPPAAPIIYAFFLLTVVLYLRLKRPGKSEARTELYCILEGLTEVLDHDLDPAERARLDRRLKIISSGATDTNLKRLANALLDYLHEDHIHMVELRAPIYVKIALSISQWIEKHLTRPRLKSLLILAFGSMGVIALIEFVILIWAIPDPKPAIESVIAPLVTRGELHSASDALWFLVRIILEGATGLALITAGGMLTIRKERQAIAIATLTLVTWLTVINLLVFYLDQFGAVATAMVQFCILLTARYYRNRFLLPPVPPVPVKPVEASSYNKVQNE